MPPVRNVEQAVLYAESFVTRYYPFRKLKRAFRDTEKGVWYVEFDVGVFNTELVTVGLDPESGEIIEYATPPAK